VQRHASNTGIIMVAGQKVALGRVHQHQTVTVVVSDTTLAVQFRGRRRQGRAAHHHPAGA
jgi:hypothetical protein